MRPAHRILIATALLAALAACSSGAVRKQINPPGASIQQLTVQPNGQWQLSVRLQNFSNVPTVFQGIEAKLTIGGQEAGNVNFTPNMSIGPESADVVTTTLTPALGAKLVVASALSAGQSTRYTLEGRIVTTTPKGDHSFNYESTLNPAPGLTGVMR